MEIDTEARAWSFEPEKDKTHIQRTHTVYFSEFAWRYIEQLRAWSGTSAWLFPNSKGTGPVCKKSVTKQIGDRQTDKPLSKRTSLTDSLALPGGKWTPHDLRRTCTTLMVELGVSPDVAHLCTYHLEQDRIKRTYNRSRQQAAQTEAWRLLGERLDLLTRDDVGNVVVVRRTA